MIRRIIGILLIIIGAATLISIFEIIKLPDISMIAAIVMIAYQVIHLVMNVIGKTHPIFGVLIPLIISVPGLVFLAASLITIPENIISLAQILIPAFLITEGLYSLH